MERLKGISTIKDLFIPYFTKVNSGKTLEISPT
jgi:hypothetical protein